MRVFNVNGSSEVARRCKCGSWLNHWKAFNVDKEKLPNTCAVKYCTGRPELGAHVQKASGSDRWYIVPLCSEHNNQKNEPLDLVETTSFAPANRSETCDK